MSDPGYCPMDSARVAQLVERDQNNANVRIPSGKRGYQLVTWSMPAQRVKPPLEEAQRAGLVIFGLVVTATANGLDRLPDALAAIEQTSGAAGLLFLLSA